MNKFKRFVALALVLCMVMAFVPAGVSAAEEDFLRVYHLDCGRKFFEIADVKEIIDLLSENGYTHLELALGNDGLRLILDDMSVLSYDGDTVAAGIKAGNVAYSHVGEWTEAQMDEIIDYAESKNIEIIPLINTPGHMDAILDAMESVGIDGAYNDSARTVDVTNAEAVEFTQALVAKYVDYFAEKGCKYFNMGADEYANDVYTEGSMGFGHLQSKGLYDEFADYVNGVAAIIKDAGMTPIAFNDGLYFNNNSTYFDTDIVAAYWTSGWGTYKVASAATLAAKGHKILNTNDGWYYVLGRDSGTYGYNSSTLNGVQNTPVTDVPGSNDPAIIGSMACLWSDEPSASYADNKSKVHSQITLLAENNADYFVVAETPEETPVESTVTKENVSITAEGLTDLNVVEATAPAIKNALNALAYELTPVTAEGDYHGGATVSLSVPANWANVRGGVLADEYGEEVLGITGEVKDGVFTFTVPHFSTVVVYDLDMAAELVEKTITVGLGTTTTDTITGGDYTASIDETELDKSIATVGATFENVVTGTGEPEKASSLTSGGTYIIGNGSGRYMVVSGTTISSTTNFEDATEFTVTGSDGNWKIQIGNYYLRHNNNNLSVSTTDSNNTWSYDGTRFYYTSGRTTYRLNTNSSGTWRVSTDTNRQGAAYTVTPATTTPTTTVTFTGMKVGTTYVTVGSVRYTIDVVAENLTNVPDMKVQWWITNLPVTTTDDNITPDGYEEYQGDSSSDKKNVYHTLIQATEANSKDGIELSTVVPKTGTSNPTAAEPNVVLYWKGVALAEGNEQDLGAGNNKTGSGTNFYYIRYYGGKWAVSEDRSKWVAVNVNSDGTQSDQLVAYYLQYKDVTAEVGAKIEDWGEPYPYSINQYVLVDYAVKYESGERVPNAFPINTSTQVFHCTYNDAACAKDSSGNWYRNIGYIESVENAAYEVYMITLTPTSDSVSTKLSSNANSNGTGKSDFYAGTEKVVWVDDEANLGDFADESLHYTSISGDIKYSVGGAPSVGGLEIYDRHGMLVTFYVRAKATKDSLSVHYIDETPGANNTEFYSYNIAVEEGVTFDAGIALPSVGYCGPLTNGTVTNYFGNPQTVSSDLSTLSQVGAQYLYTDYVCTRVERVDDKTVNLYYTFNPTVSFVVDFGLPMVISASDLNASLTADIVEDMSFTGVGYSAYGKLTDKGTTIIYEPNKVLQGVDYFTLIVNTKSEVGGILDEAAKQIAFRVYVFPATTVHYEESFATLKGFTLNGTGNAGNQETHLAGDCDMNYGFTAGYTAAGMTNGTEAVSSAAGNEAEFTFTGTGVEIYANCDPDAGTVAALFYLKNANGTETLKKFYQVDTAAISGDTGATDNQNVNSYSLPIVSATGLDHGTYRVVLMHTGAGSFLGNVHLDGFRVHNTLNNRAATAYDKDEKNPNFLELRNAVLTGLQVAPGNVDSIYETAEGFLSQVYQNEGSSATMALLLGGSTLDVQDLLDNGPKNELFLWPGESVTFKLGTNVTAQVGLKALNGTVNYSITDGTANATPTNGSITTSADMFYHNLTGTIVIMNPETSTRVLSVTKLKIFGADALEPLTVEDVAYTLSVRGYTDGGEKLARPGAPVSNPFVDVDEDSWFYDSVIWAVLKGITNGADENHFLPSAECLRAAVVTFLWRAAGCPEPESTVNPFVDVPEDAFYYKAVLWAVENGITNGVDATHFAPFTACSRAQVVTFLWRANGRPAAETSNPFADVEGVQWYTDPVLWAVENGITNGMSQNIFGVESICNRAQIVTFLYRTYKLAE